MSDLAGKRFDAALASAQGWYRDALLYVGYRRELRVEHARRMESIAARMVDEA